MLESVELIKLKFLVSPFKTEMGKIYKTNRSTGWDPLSKASIKQ